MRQRIVVAAVAAVVVLVVAAGVLLLVPPPSVAPAVAQLGEAVDVALPDGVEQETSFAAGIAGSDEILLEQRADFARPMASITKVITALVVLEAAPLSEGENGPVFTPGEAERVMFGDLFRSGSSVLPVSPDAPLTQRELLEAMLVASSANHAFIFAFQTFGTIERYREAAQAWLYEHGLVATRVVDPAGVSELDRSTARELLAIGRLALENPTIAEVIAMAEVDVPGAGTYPNRNMLLGTGGIDGIKTGTTGSAGFSFLASATVTIDGQPERLLAVVLGADANSARFGIATELLKAVREGFVRVELPAGTVVGTYEPPWGSSVDAVLAKPLDILAWRGEVRVDLTPVDATDAGTVVGRVSWLTPSGASTMDVVLAEPLPAPDPGWRLLGRWG